jgi:hypothetical protein
MQEAVILPLQRVREHQERLDELLHIARHGLEALYQQVAGMGYCVLLTDARGVTVDFIGDLQLDATLRRAGLYLGTDWSEPHAGTCGVGTAIATGQPLTVHQGDHFDATHIPLTCTRRAVATPGALNAIPTSALTAPQAEQRTSAAACQGWYAHRVENITSCAGSAALGAQLHPSVRRDQSRPPGGASTRPGASSALAARRSSCSRASTAARCWGRRSAASQPQTLGRFPAGDAGATPRRHVGAFGPRAFLHTVPPPARWGTRQDHAPPHDAAGPRRWRGCRRRPGARPADRRAARRRRRQRAHPGETGSGKVLRQGAA